MKDQKVKLNVIMFTEPNGEQNRKNTTTNGYYYGMRLELDSSLRYTPLNIFLFIYASSRLTLG